MLVSTGQVLFPTAVVSLRGVHASAAHRWTRGWAPGGSHFEFVFPSLPTTLAVCLTAGNPANASALAFGLRPTTLSMAPILPTGLSGNPADPAFRVLGPQTGAHAGQYTLKNGAATVATVRSRPAPSRSTTAVPAFACGDG